jgi:hypothetical protein
MAYRSIGRRSDMMDSNESDNDEAGSITSTSEYSQVADATSVVASSPGSSKSWAPSSPQQNRSSNKKTNSTDRYKYFAGAASSPFGEIQHDDAVPSVSPLNKAFKEFNFGNAEEDTNISLSDEYDLYISSS